MPEGLLGIQRPLGIIPFKALSEDRERTCETKEGDRVSSFTYNLDIPRRVDTVSVEVGDISMPGSDTAARASTIPINVTLIGMARRESRSFEIGDNSSEEFTIDRQMLGRKVAFDVEPEDRGFKSVRLCVE